MAPRLLGQQLSTVALAAVRQSAQSLYDSAHRVAGGFAVADRRRRRRVCIVIVACIGGDIHQICKNIGHIVGIRVVLGIRIHVAYEKIN